MLQILIRFLMLCVEVAFFNRKPITCRLGVNTPEDKKISIQLGPQELKLSYKYEILSQIL
jgi:hypothetical protein